LAGTLLVFKHQRVICPVDLRCTEQSPLPPELECEALDHIGPRLADADAAELARGIIEPDSGKRYVDILSRPSAAVPRPRPSGLGAGRVMPTMSPTMRGSGGKGGHQVSPPLKPRNYLNHIFQANVLSPPRRPVHPGLSVGAGVDKVRPAPAHAANFYSSAGPSYASVAVAQLAAEEERKTLLPAVPGSLCTSAEGPVRRESSGSPGDPEATPSYADVTPLAGSRATYCGRGQSPREVPASPLRRFPALGPVIDLSEMPSPPRRVPGPSGVDAMAQKARGSKRKAGLSATPASQRKITSFFV